MDVRPTKKSYLNSMGSKWDASVVQTFTFIGTSELRRFNASIMWPQQTEDVNFLFLAECAEYPAMSLLFGALLVGGLSSGVRHLQITTDPVKLWTGPNSQSKLEKDYFDSHFEPFYRTAQVIFIAKNSEEMLHYNSTGGLEIFGPVFNKKFMLEILKVQNHILHQVRRIHSFHSLFLKVSHLDNNVFIWVLTIDTRRRQ